jgi:hypothetical protein
MVSSVRSGTYIPIGVLVNEGLIMNDKELLLKVLVNRSERNCSGKLVLREESFEPVVNDYLEKLSEYLETVAKEGEK